MKNHFSRSMFKGIKNLLKHDGLGKQKGPKNHSNLNAGVHRKSIKKLMDLGVEIERNRDKTYPKSPFFAAAFFHRFWEGLGRVMGGFGEGVGAFLALFEPLFGVLFGCLYLECSLEGLLEAPGFDLASILKGLGLVWEGFGGPELVFFRFRNPLA